MTAQAAQFEGFLFCKPSNGELVGLPQYVLVSAITDALRAAGLPTGSWRPRPF
jgi:hypothetical protein